MTAIAAARGIMNSAVKLAAAGAVAGIFSSGQDVILALP
jgi:hypothetical protein